MPPRTTPQTARGKPVERVGVILVHGIGEQRRFEHLESETRKIVAAILKNYGKRRSDVTDIPPDCRPDYGGLRLAVPRVRPI